MVMHVQAEVDEKTYEALKRIALLKGRSLKEVVKEAIDEYIRKNRKELEEAIRKDSIWNAIGVLEAEEDASEKDEWGCVDWQSG